MDEASPNNPNGDQAESGASGLELVTPAERVEPEPGPYRQAIDGYLSKATWLDDLLDAPVVVHARSLATSLDRQMSAKGEVQSALAGSFDKCLLRLNERRPKPLGEPPDPFGDSPDGTMSILGHLSD